MVKKLHQLKILITGGAGFIGSSVADRLLQLGHKILIIDNYQTGVRENNVPHPNLTIIEGSIADSELMKKNFSHFIPEIVVHAAASYKDAFNWLEDIETNISGTVNVINSAKLVGVKKIIYLQTSLCYGLRAAKKPIQIDHPLNSGGSSYAISKTSGELYLELSKLNFISFRLANVYGPRNLSGPLPTFFQRISNNMPCTVVNTRRDFVFIDDVVNVIIKSIASQITNGYYHVGTGKDHSIQKIFDLIVKYMEVPLEPVFTRKEMAEDDVDTILLDTSQTTVDFDWLPSVELIEGIKKSIEWYKNNSISQTYTHLKKII